MAPWLTPARLQIVPRRRRLAAMPAHQRIRIAQDPVAATPMAFARVIVAAYRRYGQIPDKALKLVQITPSKLQQPDARMTARQMEVLSGAAMQEMDDEALGAFSRKLPWGSYGMLARASLSSPDLGVALKRWCRHHGLLADDIALELTVSGETAAIAVREHADLARHGEEAREFHLTHVLRNIHGLACWYVDSRIPLQGAKFPFSAPPHADAYPHMFPGPLRFGAAKAEIRFDARYLALPLKRDEKALQQMLQRALPLTVLQYRRDRLLVQQVRQVLVANTEEAHSAEGIAGLLNISARTLHRQLKDEGASLQALKDDVRCERAKDLLYRSSKPVKQVAALAGFRNEKSFVRAFKGWTGVAPGEFRKTGD
jgi:AraC-like DNA-binding protein